MGYGGCFGFSDESDAEFFQRNGAELLEALISSSDGKGNPIRIFSAKELEKATDSYAQQIFLDHTAFLRCYRGTHQGRGITVAILTDFSGRYVANEVAVLSKVNHWNVVKLVGCCLETKVPILVYEELSCKTLYEHIHRASSWCHVSWENRLKIATQAAYALAYLHAGTPSPILHLDLHTRKILLCEGNTVKITGFEFSLSLPMGKTEVECLRIFGTGGSHIDPLLLLEGGKLSDKTDVYSYGVVLFEILTGRKPFDIVDPDVKQRFCESIEEEHLISFIDSSILPEAEKGAVTCARLAQKCLNVRTLEERPEMKQVVHELQRIKGL
ncbi:hypothetical protein ACLOJK_035736 [Asimina triloba]